MTANAAASEAKPVANKTIGGVFNAGPARGNNPGARSITVASNGNTLSLEASRVPRTSNSSAFLVMV